jgi:hypothetical protein
MTNNGTTSADPPIDHRHSSTSSVPSTSATLDPTVWAPAPPFLLPDPDPNARIARRNANHHMYRTFGTNSIWHKYLDFGYYVFDDCMDFQRAWKSTAKDALSNRYNIIWKSFHLHRMHDIPLNDNLQQSAVNTVRPFLSSHDPDLLLATDIEYEEKLFFDNKDLGTQPNETSNNSEWKEVTNPRKNKKKTPTSSPTLSPTTSPTLAPVIPNVDMTHLSDETPLDLSLAHQTELQDTPNDAIPNGGVIDRANFVANRSIAHHSNPNKVSIPIVNPYLKRTNQNKSHNAMTNQNSHHQPNKSDTPTNNETRPITVTTPTKIPITHLNHAESQPTQTSTAFIDLLDDASTQATNMTNETPRQQGPSATRSVQSQFQKTNAHIPINDGTLRITIRWKPHNYDEITRDDNIWKHQAVDMLQEILHHPLVPISLVPWQQEKITTTSMTTITSLTPDTLTDICSPKISNLNSYNMSIFGIRICATDPSFSTGAWLKDSTVKASLGKHNVELNISNSTCTSGRMVVAGVILLKHPQYTHRLYFLLALRRCLPTNTPFFDIGIHQRTQNDINCPHLVVKCGENHQEALTEILSNFLNGQQTTAIYIGTKVLQSMTQEATKDLFDTHQKYVNSIQRLPLSPQIVNIDRVRDELAPRTGEFAHSRSTRAWANVLQTPEGKPLQCDAENGGRDKKAYLLVPAHLIPVVQPILQQYKQSITRLHTNDGHRNPNSTKDRPDEIYVPTESVQRNVDFLKNMSAATIWRNAPSTIRQDRLPAETSPVKGTGTTPTSHSTTFTQDPKATSAINANNHTPIRQGNSTTTALNTGNTFHPIWMPPNGNLHSRPNPQPYARQIDDNTTATLHSTASTTLNSSQHNAHRFAELEAAIKTNQSDLKQMNTQYNTMETRILETMSSCHENSKQLVVMQGQLNTLQTTLQVIADQMNQITIHFGHSENSRDAEPTL